MPEAQIPEVTNGSFNYHCTADGCNYSKRDLYGIVLHMRTHFVYETAKSDMDRATFAFQNGRYQCFDCDRNTNSMLSFKEHVRHHILKYPYTCGHCMASVASICELRKHSSSDHPKTPLQLRFAEVNRQLNTIMSSLGPVRQTFTFEAECEAANHSSGHSLCNDCDIVCSESFAQMNEGPIHSVPPTEIVSPVQRQEDILPLSPIQRQEDILPQQQSKRIAVEPNLHNGLLSRNVMKNANGKYRKCIKNSLLTSEQKSNGKVTDTVGIGKFTFTDNTFQCLTCKFRTLSEYTFQGHVGVHFHSGNSKICRKGCTDGQCPFVFGILMAINSIRRLPASKASKISSLTKQSLGNTNNEVDARKNSPIALEIPDLTSSSPLQDLSNSISASKSTEHQFPEQLSPDIGAKDSNSILKVVSSEQLSSALRFSQKSLASLRSKAGELLDFSNIASDRVFLESDEQARKREDNSGVGEETSQNSDSGFKASISEPFIIDSDDSADTGPKDKQEQKTKSDYSLLGYFHFVHDSTPLSTLCERCSYTCNCKVQLKYHKDTCHNALQNRKHEFHCPECLFSGNSKQILIWHMAHHIGSHSLTFCICSYCSYQTSSVPHIKKHLHRQHSNRSSDFKTEDSKVDYMDGIFKCPVCNAGFPWGNLFFRHVASQHGLQELADYLHTMYGEKVCPEVIRIPKVLLPNVPGRIVSPGAHSNQEETNEVFYCFKCDIGFKTSDDLIKHCSGHTKDHGEKMGDADKATDRVFCDETVIDPKQVEKPNSNIVQSTIKQLDRKKLLQPKKRKWKEISKPLQANKTKWKAKFGNSNEDKTASGLVNKRLKHGAGSKCQAGIIYKSRNNWIKKYRAPMAGKKSCVSDLPSSVPTLPRNLEMSSSSDFEKSLPNMYVFSESIKCPKCYYSDRVRLNLVRHYNGHFKDSSKSNDPKDVANMNSVSESELSFSLWQPKCSTNNREIADDCQIAVDGQESCDSNVEVSHDKTQTNDKTSTMSTKIIKIAESSGAKSQDKSNSTNAIPYFGQFLENHAKKTSKTIACDSCSETFSKDGDRDRHATSVHSSTYYVCRCCGIMVHGLSFVYKHYREMHPGSQVLVDPWTSSRRGTKRSKIQEEVSDAKNQLDNSQLSNEGRKMAGELEMNSSDQLSSATDCSISSQKKPVKDNVINDPEQQKCHSDSSQDLCITISDVTSLAISTDSTAAVSTQQLGSEVSYGNSAYPINPNPVSTSPEFNNDLLCSVLANLVSSRLACNRAMPAVQLPAPPSPMVSPADLMRVAQSLLNTPQCLNPTSAQIMALQNALAIVRLFAGTSQPDVTQVTSIIANWLMTRLSSVNASNTWKPFSSGLAADGSVSFSPAPNAALASGGATNISSLNELSNESVNRVSDSCRVTDILKPQAFGRTVVTEGDENSQPSFISLESTNNIQSCDSSTKLYDSDFNTSEPESMSGTSHCSGNSTAQRFAAASAEHSKRSAKKNHKKGYKFYSRSDILENNSDAFSANYSHVVSTDVKKQEVPLSLENDHVTANPVDNKNLCFCCHCCQYSTRNCQHFKNHLSKHLFRESSVDPKLWKPIRLRCGFCSFHTFLDEEFDEHVLTHTVDKPYQCHHCSFSTFAKGSVLRHLARFHPDLEPRFEKRKNIPVKRKRQEPCNTIINFHPVVKIRNLMTLSRMDFKCLRYDHNLKKIDLKF